MLAKSPAPGTASPGGLGVTRCAACGPPIEVVGPLRSDGHCCFCGHQLDGYDVLTEELRRTVAPRIAGCRALDMLEDTYVEPEPEGHVFTRAEIVAALAGDDLDPNSSVTAADIAF